MVTDNNCNLSFDISNISNILIKNEYQDRIECPICFELMNHNDDIIIVECCNKIFHIACLVQWYTINKKNKVCLMCNQPNNFCNDFIYYPKPIINFDTDIHIDINTERNIDINTERNINRNTYPIIISNNYKIIEKCFYVSCLILIIISLSYSLSYYLI